jgi:hypothetical protein
MTAEAVAPARERVFPAQATTAEGSAADLDLPAFLRRRVR